MPRGLAHVIRYQHRLSVDSHSLIRSLNLFCAHIVFGLVGISITTHNGSEKKLKGGWYRYLF